MMEKISKIELAWLGGIIDGEGNISAGVRNNANGASYLDVKVRIANTDVRMMYAVGKIYEKMNLVFFNSLANRMRDDRKTALNVEVARQGSTKKLLNTVYPFLIAKRKLAVVTINLIDYVQSIPRSGNGVRRNYATHNEFHKLMECYRSEKDWYYDPSTTTRKARKAICIPKRITSSLMV